MRQLNDVLELAGMEAKTEATPRFQSYGTRCGTAGRQTPGVTSSGTGKGQTEPAGDKPEPAGVSSPSQHVGHRIQIAFRESFGAERVRVARRRLAIEDDLSEQMAERRCVHHAMAR